MTTEELLMPRYEVIADYPNKPYTMPIGHILTLNKFGAGKWWHEFTDDEPIHLDEGSTRFPDILKKLEWWEKRDIKDMPKYIKIIDENVIAKVEQHISDIGFTYKETDYFTTEHERKKVYSTNVLPSTEQEYNDNLKNQQP